MMSCENGYKSIIAITLFAGLWLVGCNFAASSTVSEVEPEQICEEVGVVENERIEDTSRGYGYTYRIYLPPCYADQTEHEYPILYLLPGMGGGPGSWFGIGVDKMADEMILSGEIPSFLIVGTEVTSSDPMGEIIFNDLVPHIENNYRVKPERLYHAVAGGSLGSIGAYRLAFQHPDYFASAGMFGGGVISGEEAQVETWLAATSPENQPRVFFNTGEQDPLMLAQAEVMIGIVEGMGVADDEIFAPGEHTYGYWVSNFPEYFKWLAEVWEREAG